MTVIEHEDACRRDPAAAAKYIVGVEAERDEWRRISAEQQADYGKLQHQLQGAVEALAILNEAMGDVASAEWPDDARTYIARAAAALGGQ
jgi:hypothetical protein